uniref:pancreatic alpha-amylase n=1 Tax=Lonchura striata TaxID=40157 RepID=UPI000B4DD861|nr:pancreatic alpha-amylase [Lonchura striata domestica]
MGIYFLLLVVGLCWGQYNPNTLPKRTSIVHLFEWRWQDIAQECERYLAPNGFGGVQISPPNENVIITDPQRPWWERYQPVSYKLCTRSGNETEFRDMVTRCNNVGVHIYVDAVINHMCGANAGAGDHATCGSYFNSKTEDFPAVPYSSWDFNDQKCKSRSGNIENYHDISQVRDCRLASLLDLALEKEYVRSRIAGYLNQLVAIGVAGFRIDAAKHMWPADVKAILDKLEDLNTQWFPAGTKPFIYQEVIDLGGEPITGSQYFGNGRVTEFKYGAKLGTVLRKWDGEKMAYLKNMVIFRNVVDGEPFSNWWDNGSNQVAFGRGNKGFIIFNNDDWSLNASLQTGLPAGTYCDIISGQKEGDFCTAVEVHVAADGIANFLIGNDEDDPFIAIHVDAKL